MTDAQRHITEGRSMTAAFYADKAKALDFFERNVSVDMSSLHARFVEGLPPPPEASIWDAGCGSGRDARAFASLGYQVSAFDASPELCRLASKHCGFKVAQRTFQDVSEEAAYDGIWCCASLLHVPSDEMPEVLGQLWRALKPGGSLFATFKPR